MRSRLPKKPEEEIGDRSGGVSSFGGVWGREFLVEKRLACLKSPVGYLAIEVDGEERLVEIEFVEGAGERGLGAVKKVVGQLREYFEGRRKEFELEIAFERGSEFQRRVWREIAKVGFGERVSYQELARRAGRPRAVRAVANACGANPVPIVVGCHRVVGSGGRLGGYAGGIERKKWLLRHEEGGVAW